MLLKLHHGDACGIERSVCPVKEKTDLSGAIYSRIAPLFALNCIFFSANENGTVIQNNQSDFKVQLK